MPFIDRDEAGVIVGVYACQQYDGQEFADHAELQPTQAEVIAEYESALDAHLDSVAKAHRFSDRHSLSLRAAYLNAWQPLGATYGTWMDGCNVQAYALLKGVLDGTAPLPTVEQFIAGLPPFVAPAGFAE